MPPEMRPKACCRIGTRSVIEHALETYEEAGIRRHVIVVGHYADRVMAEVTKHQPGALFAYQSKPKGTGDAARRALDLLAADTPPDYVLISAGDKVIAPRIINGLLQTFEATEADLCLAVGACEEAPAAGRVIVRDEQAVGIIEVPDINVRKLARRLQSLPEAERPRTREQLAALAAEYFPKPGKLATVFPALNRLLSGPADAPLDWTKAEKTAAAVPESFTLPVGEVPLEEADAAPISNLSVYVGKFDVVRNAVNRLRADNVQGEWYLTDIVQILAADGARVTLFRSEAAQDIMAFNTIEELEEIRRIAALQPVRQVAYPTIGQWGNYAAHQNLSKNIRDAVNGLGNEVGPDAPAILVRSPGRVNLMGRHIDHQGGTCNLLAINREVVMAATPREDDRINLWNTAARDYPYRSFSISELTADIDWEDWLHTLDTQFIQRYVAKNAGDWVNYIQGAALRLQHRFRDRKLCGMDAYVAGDIPTGAGLSSSSALVVATAEALVELNSLNVTVKELIDLCGEGEWFVGTRGGSADHAAIKYSRANEVVKVSFFPFRVLEHFPFPPGCRLMVCYSGVSANKTQNARERFNARVACYHMAREMIKREYPHLAPLIQHLRDVNTNTLDISLPALYALIKSLPNRIPHERIFALAMEHPTVAKCVAGTTVDRYDFPLRDVTLYGLAEMERGALTGELLRRGDAEALGRMMSLSHDGDRVAAGLPEQKEFYPEASDELMDGLIARSAALQPLAQSGAALWQQPGAYACSTPEIDHMVDLALACEGVLGAQLAGAGLGGCIMILARDGACDRVRETLAQQYYAPREIEPRVYECAPSRGSQVLTTVEAET